VNLSWQMAGSGNSLSGGIRDGETKQYTDADLSHFHIEPPLIGPDDIIT
jgi:hypothetical protein